MSYLLQPNGPHSGNGTAGAFGRTRFQRECNPLAIKSPHKMGFASFSLQTRKQRRWAPGVGSRVLQEGAAGALLIWPTRCFACQAMPGARRTQPSDAGLGATSTTRPGLNGTLGVAKIRRGSSKPLSVGSTHSATGPAICINSNQKSTFKNETALAGPRSVDACGKA